MPCCPACTKPTGTCVCASPPLTPQGVGKQTPSSCSRFKLNSRIIHATFYILSPVWWGSFTERTPWGSFTGSLTRNNERGPYPNNQQPIESQSLTHRVSFSHYYHTPLRVVAVVDTTPCLLCGVTHFERWTGRQCRRALMTFSMEMEATKRTSRLLPRCDTLLYPYR